jgi:hypothetical protein
MIAAGIPTEVKFGISWGLAILFLILFWRGVTVHVRRSDDTPSDTCATLDEDDKETP